MASRKTTTTGTSALAPIPSQWAERVERALTRDRAATAIVGGLWPAISTRGGVFALEGTVLGHELDVVVLGASVLHAYYDRPFDPNVISPPACWAIGQTVEGLAPDRAKVVRPQAESCATCWASAFGSGKRSDGTASRGKACSERRRVALLPADDMTPEALRTAKGAILSLPVTSVKTFGLFARKITDGLKRPLSTVVVRCTIRPDAKSQFAIEWELLRAVEPQVLDVIFDRVDEAEEPLYADPASGDEKQAQPSTQTGGRQRVPARNAPVEPAPRARTGSGARR